MRRFLPVAAMMGALSAFGFGQGPVESGVPESAPPRVVAPLPAEPLAIPSSLDASVSAPAETASLELPSIPAALPSAAVGAVSAAAEPGAPSVQPEAPSAAPEGVSAAPSPAEGAAPAALPAEPRRWDFTRWREAFPTEDVSRWSFSERWLSSARLWDGWRKAPLLGEGVMGSVFVHPWDSDRVVKVARRGYKDAAGEFFAPDDESVLSYEDYDLARLAAAGAAPRPLARLTISGRPASARERVRGWTVAYLRRAGLFGPREHALVNALLGRIAEAGFVARDLNLGNIMIGRIGAGPERAWLVDALGVSVRDDLDAPARKARMLADRVPWIAFQGFGISRPLSRALDGALRPRLGYETEPLAWPRWRRWTTLAGLLATLAAAPPLIHAAPLGAPLSLGLLPSWPALAAFAAVIALAGIPLRLFAHRLAPWVMTRRPDAGDGILRRGPVSAVPELAIAAATEELMFRAGLFLAGAALLHAVLPAAAAIVAASFISSMVFALLHGYGSVWTRAVGGLLYAGAFVVSGSLLLPVAAHFLFNLALYVHGRYLR